MSDPMVGHVLDGRYEIQRKMARGGMATVYLATDLRLTRTVAVKVMHQGLGDDQDFAAKFDREARAAARLSHPNVVSVFDQGIDQGRPYIVMECVEGCTLRHLITREAPFDPLRALDLLLPVANALAAAHEAGLIHRDVKPENVLISDRGQVKVADFGLARAITAQTATATGLLIGTVSYIAPELVTHGKADPRCDVYAFGVILYEMLTGQKPHTGDTPIQVAYSHVHKSVPPPSSTIRTSWRESRSGIPPYLDALVTTAAARKPADRPQDGRVLLHHLRAARDALARGVMDDPKLTEQLRRTDVDPDHTTTEVVPTVTPATDVVPRLPKLRFTPSTPVSPGFPESADGLPYYDGPHADPKPLVTHPKPHPRRRRLLALVLSLVVLFGLVGGWYAFVGRYTSVPDLHGLKQERASEVATEAGFSIDFSNEYSEDVPAGQVVRTDPAVGDRILIGGSLTAFVSKGVERYPAPTLTGLSVDDATAALTTSHLAVGQVTEAYHDTAPLGTVTAQSEKPGTSLKPDAEVDLVVSKGPAPVKLGDWTGKSLSDATKALTKDGLKTKVTKESYSDTVTKGDIIAQTPAAGEVHRGDTVSFEVSKGPTLVVVPNVRGKGVQAATEALKAAGFKVRLSYLVGSGFGLVLRSSPPGGTKAPRGSTITLYLV